MRKATGNTIIRMFSILALVFGIVFLTRAAGYGIDTKELEMLVGISDSLFRSVVFVIGCFFIAFSLSMQRHMRWARTAALVISSLAIIGGTFFLVRCEEVVCTSWLLSMPLNVLRILVGAFGLWFFGHAAEHTFKS